MPRLIDLEWSISYQVNYIAYTNSHVHQQEITERSALTMMHIVLQNVLTVKHCKTTETA